MLEGLAIRDALARDLLTEAEAEALRVDGWRRVQPLSTEWLGDLAAFAEADMEAADKAREVAELGR